MKPQQKNILLGLSKRITDIIDAQSELFFKERPFLTEGGLIRIVELSEDDKRREDQLERDFSAVTMAFDSFVEKIFPTLPPKQGDLL